jgi:hypothetical protein
VSAHLYLLLAADPPLGRSHKRSVRFGQLLLTKSSRSRVALAWRRLRVLRAERLGWARTQKDPQAATHGIAFVPEPDGADDSYRRCGRCQCPAETRPGAAPGGASYWRGPGQRRSSQRGSVLHPRFRGYRRYRARGCLPARRRSSIDHAAVGVAESRPPVGVQKGSLPRASVDLRGSLSHAAGWMSSSRLPSGSRT